MGERKAGNGLLGHIDGVAREADGEHEGKDGRAGGQTGRGGSARRGERWPMPSEQGDRYNRCHGGDV